MPRLPRALRAARAAAVRQAGKDQVTRQHEAEAIKQHDADVTAARRQAERRAREHQTELMQAQQAIRDYHHEMERIDQGERKWPLLGRG
jgi:hypothetical protein